jgi:hypothetical protein
MRAFAMALAPDSRAIVEAEIVRPAPPIRFGLRELMVVTALCSVQFAVMNYLGVLAGFAVGGAVCLAGMTAAMAAGLWIGRTDRELFSRLDGLVMRFVLALTAIAVSGGLSGGGILLVKQLEPLRHAWWLERQLGLKTERSLAWLDDAAVEVLVVKSIAPGQPADQAGIKAGDQIRPLPTVNEFYRSIYDRRGQNCDLTLYRGGSALNKLDSLTEIDVTIAVPAK